MAKKIAVKFKTGDAVILINNKGAFPLEDYPVGSKAIITSSWVHHESNIRYYDICISRDIGTNYFAEWQLKKAGFYIENA